MPQAHLLQSIAEPQFRTSCRSGSSWRARINAGTFGPNELDLTFGPEIRYQSVTAGMKQNLPPTEGKQYFGAVRIEGATEAMTVSLHDVKGDTLFRVSLDPEA